MKNLGCKHTIMLGLLFEMLQLLWYGFGTTTWMMWAAGILASMSSITYPAISAFVSIHSTADRQGVVQGRLHLQNMITTRSLCVRSRSYRMIIVSMNGIYIFLF